MKYLYYFEKNKKESQVEQDINYLTKQLSYQTIDYIKETIDYYEMTEEEIHNLRLAVEYQYLYHDDYSNVISQVINSNREYPKRVWAFEDSEIKL